MKVKSNVDMRKLHNRALGTEMESSLSMLQNCYVHHNMLRRQDGGQYHSLSDEMCGAEIFSGRNRAMQRPLGQNLNLKHNVNCI